MPGRDIVVIGASAGGIPAIKQLVSRLPEDLDASVFIVVHTSPGAPGILPRLLDVAGPLHAEFAPDAHLPVHGRIYVAPPDFHVLFKNREICVAHGPKENGFRPAVDPLFRTAARNYGPRVVGVILSGGLDDGTDGMRIIKECGGIAIAQHPEEAEFPSMPASCIRNVAVDHISRLDDIPDLLVRYSKDRLPKEQHMCAGGDPPDIAESGDSALKKSEVLGSPSALTCPECGGALWESKTGSQLRFRCHVGHMFTGDGLVSEVSRTLEQSLWTAVRVMEEAAEIRRRMARVADQSKWKDLAPPYNDQAAELEHRAAVIRRLLEESARAKQVADDNGSPPDTPTPPRKPARPKKRR
ncbi:MAG: chemotaxis protein CheB [Phycisphaerae bacterium]